MAERFPTNAVSHAELDKDLYSMDLSDAALLDRRADAAAMNRVKQEQIQEGHEKRREMRAVDEMAAGAIRAFQATQYDGIYAAQAEAREQAATEDGAMRAYRAREAGENMDPTLHFTQKQQKYDQAAAQLAAAGDVKTLNGSFAHAIEKVTDEEGSIDVSKLNKNDLIRYRSSIGWQVGEDATAYNKRMESVFGTPDYIKTVAEILEPNDIWDLKRIHDRSPGVNPLADALARHLENEEIRQSA